MARRSGRGCAALAILLVASTVAVLSRPAAALSDDDLVLNATGVTDGMLSYDYHAVSCPHLRTIVRSYVQNAVSRDNTITPGLLRIHFHDCFPQGCDASIFLNGPNSERGKNGMPANANLNARALNLVENIRRHVHAVCGATVSCADITAVATAEAVYASGGPLYAVPLGQRDSFAPASSKQIQDLPSPLTDNVNQLMQSFCKKGLCSVADLVALSGAHTVGYAHCKAFENRFSRVDNAFVRQMQLSCARNPSWVQILDAFTPYRFDNGYFFAVYYGKGVLTSDVALRNDQRTLQYVYAYAGNQNAFFQQFASSMQRLSYVPKPQGNVGEIRRFSCFRTNRGSFGDNIDDFTATGTDEESASVVDVTATLGSPDVVDVTATVGTPPVVNVADTTGAAASA